MFRLPMAEMQMGWIAPATPASRCAKHCPRAQLVRTRKRSTRTIAVLVRSATPALDDHFNTNHVKWSSDIRLSMT